jgi:Tfp pilus assembly major pilin PilA
MRKHTAVTWISFCVVLAIVAALAWLAIHYLERASF